MTARRVWVVVALSALIVGGCATGPGEERASREERAKLHAQLGANYISRNQYEIALQELETALAIDGDNATANFVMGVLQTRLRNDEKAARYFRKALAVRPDYPEAQHEYGILLCRQGRYAKAFSRFGQALNNPLHRAPEVVNLHAGECILKQPQPDLKRAEQYLRTALAHNPRLSGALYRMAELKRKQGEYLSARAYMQRYFSVAAETPQALEQAIAIEKKLGATDLVSAYRARLRKKFPNSEQAKKLH